MKTKKLLLSALVVIVSLSSCVKKATCTCKDASGTVVSTTSRKTTSKSDIDKFKEDCKKSKYTSGSTSIPCEVS